MSLDLDAIKARCEAATEGPWSAASDESWEFWFPGTYWAITTATRGWGEMPTENQADAEFIAHARTDVPALIAEVERLRRQIDTLSEANECRCFVEGCPCMSAEEFSESLFVAASYGASVARAHALAVMGEKEGCQSGDSV